MRGIRAVLACAAAGLAFSVALSGVVSGSSAIGASERAAAECGPISASRAAGLAPNSCDAVVVIDRTADLAASATGLGTLRVLDEVGLFSSTSRAWTELATALGMTPAEAMRAIAGSRTMLMLRRESVERPAAWALLTEVEPATERLIRERLKPVPRQIVEGQPVLMLENGRFLLATHRPKRSREGGERAAVLIAPSDSPELFASCLPMLVGKPASGALGDDARGSLVLEDGACDVFAIYRARVGDEPDAPRTLAAVSAVRVEGGWSARVACEPGMLGDAATIGRVAIPGGLFRAASEGAMIAFGAPISDRRDAGSAYGRLLYRFFADVAPLFDGSGVFALRERPMVDGGDGRARAEIVIGASVKPGGGSAAAFDGGMATVIDRLARSAAPAMDALDFGGRFPSAVREAALSPRAFSVVTPMIGTSPVIRWCYSGMEGEDATMPRWWMAQVVESSARADGSTLRAIASSLSPDPEAIDTDPDVWTTIGVVRPSRALALMPPLLLSIAKPMAPAHWIDTAGWKGRVAPDGLVRGEAWIEFLPEAMEPWSRDADAGDEVDEGPEKAPGTR